MLRCRVKVTTINPLFGRVSAMRLITLSRKCPFILQLQKPVINNPAKDRVASLFPVQRSR